MTKWTNVKDGLPTDEKLYLCEVKTSKYMRGLLLAYYGQRPDGRYEWSTKREVVAWYPIPQRYEEDKGECKCCKYNTIHNYCPNCGRKLKGVPNDTMD